MNTRRFSVSVKYISLDCDVTFKTIIITSGIERAV